MAVDTLIRIATDMLRVRQVIPLAHVSSIGEPDGPTNDATLNLPNHAAICNCLGAGQRLKMEDGLLEISRHLRLFIHSNERVAELAFEAFK